ncbi:MAG: gliding motility-associated-like protein [Litorivivens sp.]
MTVKFWVFYIELVIFTCNSALSKTLKKITLIIAPLLMAGQSFGQIDNASFEDHTGLPSSTGEYQKCVGWGNAGSDVGSPDYYHYAGSQAGDIPETPVAMVNAWNGSAVMGMTVCGNEHTNYREYISNVLTEPLKVGSQYVVTFRMTNGDLTNVSLAGLAVSDIGVYFSTQAQHQTGNEPLIVSPQFSIETKFYSKEWKLVRFVFEANQSFEHMTVGLFGNDSSKDFEVVEGNPQFAYCFFDDFFIQEIQDPYEGSQVFHIEEEKDDGQDPTSYIEPIDEDTDVFFIPNAFTPNNDGDNDVFRPVSPSHEKYHFEVFSRWGELMFSTKDPDLGWDGKFAAQLAEPGVYVWRVSYHELLEEENPSKEKQIHGTVNLLR